MLLRIALLWAAAVLSLAGAENQWAGTYAGDWASTSGMAKGDFRITLTPAAEGKWKCEVVFTMGDLEVKTAIKSLEVSESKIEVSYEFDLANNRLLSTVTGALAGSKLEGKYQTKSVPEGAPVDEGIWKAVSKK